jgi:TRAP-type C4-dicarboxylate transport system permease small subunit
MKQDKRLLLTVKKIASVFNSVVSILGIILMVLMIFTLSAGIISRYVFNRPFFWTDEAARIILIWTIFIGAALGFRKNSPIAHIRVDFLGSFLSSELRKIVKRIVWSLIILFCIAITVIDINFIALAGSIKTAALGIPKFIIYITLLIFALITLLFSLEQWLAQGNNEGKP